VRPLSALRRLRGVDVLHAHGYKAGALGLPYARARRTPLTVTWHNAVLPGRGAVAGRLLQAVVARGADLTLGASSDLVAEARLRGARRALLSPVAAPRLPAAATPRQVYRSRLGVEAGDVLVVSVGRLAPQKNLGMVLDIAAALRDVPRLRFVIAGDGPLHAELAARAHRDGARVRLVGRCEDVASLLGAADAVLLTSAWEARALVAQEALLAGVPLFSTRVGGIEELVGDAAVLFEPGAVAAAAEALRQTIRHPERLTELSYAGLRRALSWPDEDEVAATLAEVYADLVARRAASRSTGRHRST